MKISELWLREWVNPPLTAKELSAQLTMAGLEVDAVYPVAGQFNNVIVALVQSTAPHPQADKLTLCQVSTGNGSTVQIVCGATNVRAGLHVALAMPGAALPNGMQIKETSLRGQLSQGMLCSFAELGMEERSEGIIELAPDAPVGTDIRDYLQLDDSVLDIDLTPNRADCLSIYGVARDIAALNAIPLNALPGVQIQPAYDEIKQVNLAAPAACPQVSVRIMRGCNPDASTPFWMRERLRRAGLRPIHPVVDVTNYVMLELGQPMHAYDLHTINGDITVRFGKAQETLCLLDGKEVTLDERVLVVADNQKALSIAGVMGGEASAVQAHTADIVLESAFFNPVAIAGVARRYGLSTDSSQRFERGVDPMLQVIALERATELLQAIVGGEAGPLFTVKDAAHMPPSTTIAFNPATVEKITGVMVPIDGMKSMLQHLGMAVDCLVTPWRVTVPSHRFDIQLEVDLVEEVIRIYGYDKLTAQPLVAAVHAGKSDETERLVRHMASFFASRGYQETISYSFVDPVLQEAIYPDAQALTLVNPLSSEMSQMRLGMWPGLIASMVHNLHRQQTAIQFFEAGVIFDVTQGILQERACIAGLVTGDYGHLNWGQPQRKLDFFDVKGDLQALLSALLPEPARFEPAVHPALHPGKSAQLWVGDQAIGWIGALHPLFLDELDVQDEVILFEITLLNFPPLKKAHYRGISKYPHIRRDLSLLVAHAVRADQIEAAIRQVDMGGLFKGFNVFDVYTGDPIPADKKSLAVALTLQDGKRTLVDAEINAIISAIITKLDDEFSIILRE